MTTDDIAFIDGIVTEFRSQLLKVGYLRRINNTQRTGLSAAYSLVLSLPALVRARAQEQAQTTEKD